MLSKQVSNVYEAEEMAKLYECIQLHCGSDSLPFSISYQRTRELTEKNCGACNKKTASSTTNSASPAVISDTSDGIVQSGFRIFSTMEHL